MGNVKNQNVSIDVNYGIDDGGNSVGKGGAEDDGDCI